MRAEIQGLAADGKSERQIIDLYKARYGRRILGEPEGLAFWIATLVPLAASVCGLCFLLRIFYFASHHPRMSA